MLLNYLNSIKIVVLITLLISIFFVGTLAMAKPLEIGVMFLGSVKDAGWNQAHYEGIMAMKKHFGKEVKIIWVDGVGTNYANVISTLNMLVAQGCQLIFATAWDFMDPTIEISKKYPNIIFEHCSGYKRTKNVGTYFAKMYNMDYLAGMIAGIKTKKNSIGLVLPQPIPEVVRQANAFTIGVKKTNPKAIVKIVWTHSWYDPATEAEFADALIEGGADVLAHGCDSPAAVLEAEKKKVYAIGYGLDQAQYAPKKWLTAPLWNWGHTYISIVQEVMDKKWSSKAIWDKKGVKLAEFGEDVNPQTVSIINNEYVRIMNGYNPFTGPLYDQKGNLKLEKGQVMSDEDIWNIFWLIKGIQGNIPK